MEISSVINQPSEDVVCVRHNSNVESHDQKDKTTVGLDRAQGEQMGLSNPHTRLTIIEAVLNDEVEHLETPQDKKKAIKATLALLPTIDRGNIEQRLYEDPHKKVDQITQVIEDNDLHIYKQFENIQSILDAHENCNNPWLQAHQALLLIENSSRQSINREEERQVHLKQLWTMGMDDKAHFYPEMAKDQKWWQYLGVVGMVASLSIPLLGRGLGQSTADLVHPLLSKVMTIEVDQLVNQIQTLSSRAPDLMNGVGAQAIQIGSNTSSLLKRDRETLHEWATQQERQNLEAQQQVIQEARQNHHSLKERHLEIIKTLTNQLMGR